MRYPDCECTNGCGTCSLSSYGKDCRGNPANYVAFLRVSAGLTQKELAEKIGTAQQYIAKIEHGDITLMNVTGRKLLMLSRALGVTIEMLLGNVE